MFAEKKKKILFKFKNNKPIVCLTSYTAPIAKIADKYADLVLVGDSVGTVLYDLSSTREVNIEMMIRHGKAVVKNINKAITVIDMPYGTYENDKFLAYENAKRIVTETGADAVKLEGGEKIFKTVSFLINKGINVMGHIGLQPQSVHGSYKVYGKKKGEQTQILKDLFFLEDAGVFSVVIECTIQDLVKKVIKNSKVPIIGIGATSECNGQILVAEDLLGLTQFDSKFLKKFENLNLRISKAFSNFSKDVKNRKYPQKKNCYK